MSKGTVNKVILVGRLGADPDIRYSPNGVAIAKFNLATNDSVPAGEGKWEEKTEWHRVTTFGKTAEFCGNYLAKGRMVYVEGSIRTNQWDDPQGQKRYFTEIIAREIQMLGSADGQGQGQNQSQSHGQGQQGQGQGQQGQGQSQGRGPGPEPAGDRSRTRNAGRSAVEELPPNSGGAPDDDIPF